MVVDLPNCQSGSSDADWAGASQSIACYTSAHRYCARIGKPGIGIVVEYGVPDMILTCVPYTWYGVVEMVELSALHQDCNSFEKAQDGACKAAVHRWCYRNKFGDGGVITEARLPSRPNEVEVGCMNGKMVSVRP